MKATTKIIISTVSFLVILNVIALAGIAIAIDNNQLILGEAQSCEDGNYKDVSRCLNDEFSKFYFFNMTNVGKKLNESEFKEQGGVCRHAAEWYKGKAESLGLKAEISKIYGTNFSHVFTIIYDYYDNGEIRGYCVLDQSFLVGCMTLAYINASEAIK